MNIVVLLAGVADPRQALPRPESGDWKDIWQAAGLAYKLSPFDEAALEIGLKLRTAAPGSTLAVLVTDGCGDAALMRAVAALRPDTLAGLARPPAERWQPWALAQRVGEALRGLPEQPALVLMGREHGDTDDGAAAPYLAESLGLAHAGLALEVKVSDGMALCVRMADDAEETVALPLPALVSISNDRRNRLRHPLLKNVLHAKQQKFAVPPAAVLPGDGPPLVLAEARPAADLRQERQPCRMATGSVREQAAEVASFLRPWIEQASQS